MENISESSKPRSRMQETNPIIINAASETSSSTTKSATKSPEAAGGGPSSSARLDSVVEASAAVAQKTNISSKNEINTMNTTTSTTTNGISRKRRSDSSSYEDEHHHHLNDHEEQPLQQQQQQQQQHPTQKRRTATATKRTRSIHRMTWEERLLQLKEYKAKHGNLLIPIRFKENPSLGKFVHNTREQYKLYKNPQKSAVATTATSRATGRGKVKRCSLTSERVFQLEELGFVWSTERSKHQKEDWEQRLQQLKEYKAKHGDCLVPHGYPQDPSFAEWVHRQRTTHAHMVKEEEDGTQSHRHHHNPLVMDRMKQLEDLGFHFTVHADKWMEHWRELKSYRDIHGHCQVPTHCPNNPKLGRWVHTQRHQRRLQLKGKKSCMTNSRVEMLNSLGFSWEVRPHHHHHHDDHHHDHNQDRVVDEAVAEDLTPMDPNNGEDHGGLLVGGDQFLVSMDGDDVFSPGSGNFHPVMRVGHPGAEGFVHPGLSHDDDPHDGHHGGQLSMGDSDISSNEMVATAQDLECTLQAAQQQEGSDPNQGVDFFVRGMTMV